LGREVLRETGAAGLMLGRGAIADPLLFERLRGRQPAELNGEGKRAELGDYLTALLVRYQEIFCGEHQILCKMKEVLCQVRDPEVLDLARELKRSKSLAGFTGILADQAR